MNYLLLSVYFTTALVLSCTKQAEADSETTTQSCFCKLKGEVDDCSCTVESVDSFNNLKIYPRIEALVRSEYFKHFKTNLQRSCLFWEDDSKCTFKECTVAPCSDDTLPIGLKSHGSENQSEKSKGEVSKYSEESQDSQKCSEERQEQHLGSIDTRISEESRDSIAKWTKHDDEQTTFCVIEDESSSEARYYNLVANPEAFTAYKGESAWRIWRSIYQENCFTPSEDQTQAEYQPFFKGYRDGRFRVEGMCLEKRVFYRAVSGLHASINTHLCARHLSQDAMTKMGIGFGKKKEPKFERNVDEFKLRFSAATTGGRGPQWLKNLYFIYLLELRALAKAAPYLREQMFFTGNKEMDKDTRKAVNELLDTISSFKEHFDESKLFVGDALTLKEEFRQKFLNISRIMDCVGCQKCRLWGKLQVLGLGTSLKILVSGTDNTPGSLLTEEHRNGFSLNRNEIVALFNAFGRLSTSIREVENFRRLMKDES